MKNIMILFKSVFDVKEFVGIVNDFEYDVDLVSGRYVVDAKSIMGIFSLDLMKPVKVEIHSDESDELILRLAPFLYREQPADPK